MSALELKKLVSCLAPQLVEALQSAAADCVSRHHQFIEVEHWLLQVLTLEQAELSPIFKQYGVPQTQLRERLLARINSYAGGYDRTPGLSAVLVKLLQEAWFQASVNHQQPLIRAVHLLLVLTDPQQALPFCPALTDLLEPISREHLAQLAGASAENSAVAPDAEDSTPALDKYTHNLTAAARAGQLDRVIGRQREIRQLIDVLIRRRQNNPILVGEPGVGKTALVEGLALDIVAGEVPPPLLGVEVRTLDLALLQAGASIQGEFENRLKDVLAEVKTAKAPIIMFIDEAHTMVGAGGKAGQNDAANLLKPALARGEFRTIAATTWAEYKQYFEKDAALSRRFQPVKVEEPAPREAIAMVRHMAGKLAAHHQVPVTDEAIVAAVNLSARYLPERKLPDKAVSLLDTACALVSLSQTAKAARLSELEQDQDALIQERKQLQEEHQRGYDRAELLAALTDKITQAEADIAQLQNHWQQQRDQVEALLAQEQACQAEASANAQVEVEGLNRTLAALQDESEVLVHARVDAGSVAKVIEHWTGIPTQRMLQDDLNQLLSLEQHLGERIIGQQQAIAEICQAVRISRAGIGDRRKPVGVFLLCGPSGVGKTETALALADRLYGGERDLTIINMTEFKEPHKVSMLLGAPAGYVGYGEGGVLTEAVRRNPHSVLLLDEMEKAHPEVQDLFYRIFDKGRITDSEGREVDFRNTLIIMTTNAGDNLLSQAVAQYREQGLADPELAQLREPLEEDLLRVFKPAFLGRSAIIPFLPLQSSELAQIAELAFARLERRLQAQYQAELVLGGEVIPRLLEANLNPNLGARAIELRIQRQLMPALAVACLEQLGQGETIARVEISWSAGEPEFTLYPSL